MDMYLTSKQKVWKDWFLQFKSEGEGEGGGKTMNAMRQRENNTSTEKL